MRLSKATVSALPPAVTRPVGSEGPVRRIVHLGIGAFHRAHQAVYTQDAGEGWRITGVSLRSPTVRDTLAPQNFLYTVTERANGAVSTRLIDVIDRVLVAPDDAQAIVDALADPQTHIVTLTVTEKGYYRNPADGSLRIDDPAVVHDLSGAAPQTIYGFLAAGLARRRAKGAGGLTILPCDNLPGNGASTWRLLTEYLTICDPDLLAWADRNVTAPDTMVDRIVPATTPKERRLAAEILGQEDAGAIVTEPFRQWVMEDRFAGPRPAWCRVGAQVVADVAPFELAKLRLLNASHSTVAYIGLQCGHTHVHEAVADPGLRRFVIDQLAEAVPTLRQADGLNPDAYIAAILDRFGNADLRHRLDQIAMDGSLKLPQRWFVTVADRLDRGEDSPRHVTAIAAWIAYTADAPAIAGDPQTTRYRAIWDDAGDDPEQAVAAYICTLDIFPSALTRLVAPIAQAMDRWRKEGARACLA